MRRRDFIGLIGSGAAWPLMALAQQPERMRRIGILIPQYKSAQGEAELAAFRGALHELGWTEGSTATFQMIWAGGDLNQIKSHAKELVAWDYPGAHHASDQCVAAGEPCDPYNIRQHLGSGRGRFCCKHVTTGRQRHRLYQCRTIHGRQVGRAP
jgi:hypothetical protein